MGMGLKMKYAGIWQTPLATVAALAIFFPMLMVAFVAVACLDFVQRLFGGWDGEGLSFYMIGVQWGFASAGAVFLPHFVFKRGNPWVVCWTLAGLTIAALLFLAVGALINGDDASFNQWLTFVSIPLGTVIGAHLGAGAVLRRWPKPLVPASATASDTSRQ